LFGGVSDENVARIKRQNKKKISVVIGNPPYNANQLNENENNKNREYPEIDRRIKATYIANSTAQKTKLYDMYARFFRWASDRIDENGIVAFVTNRSFVESRTFDGFRKMVADEFNNIYVVDLGGDVRADPRLSGTKHNVFGIQTGVAIGFMVKRAKAKGCRIHYARRPQLETAEDKLTFLENTKIAALAFEEVQANARHDWINQSSNDFDTLIEIASPSTKSAKNASQERAIFRHFSLGIATNRDEWAYDWTVQGARRKVKFFCDFFNSELERWKKSKRSADVDEFVKKDIKWTSELAARLKAGEALTYAERHIDICQYRPFVTKNLYYDDVVVHRVYQQDKAFPPSVKDSNQSIAFLCVSSNHPLATFAVGRVFDLCLLKTGNGGTFGVSRYRYVGNGERLDNITDWALDQFQAHYQTSKILKRQITKDAIFHYVYGVLHDPVYREKYALNLRRDFPRIPFYADFWRWADWGEKLMALHINYETVEPSPLKRVDVPDEKSRKAGLAPKTTLKSDKEQGNIQIDCETQLTGLPPEAWGYKLGNRSALEWVLDQYRERTPKDPTIREKFNTYRFADHKEKVIDLLKRVTRVSVETMKIVEAMKSERR
jgi:predicted helicase